MFPDGWKHNLFILFPLLTVFEVKGKMEKKDLGATINTYDMAAGEALGKREGHTPRIEAPAKAKPDYRMAGEHGSGVGQTPGRVPARASGSMG